VSELAYIHSFYIRMNHGITSPSLPALARSPNDPTLRLRPGDRPQWLEAPVADEVLLRWRGAARKAGLPVDAWVALLLELELVVEELSELYEPVLESAAHMLKTPRLAFGDSRRRWVRQLSEISVPDDSDELPSLALPSRLLARIPPSEQACRFLSIEGGDLDAAKTLDLAAIAEGLTMEAWAYRCALRLARR
jgi:hypothetical protein